MKFLSESDAIERLGSIRDEFTQFVRTNYEHRAMPCAVCPTPGACCLDEHFVNVRITRLEAKAIRRVIAQLPAERRQTVLDRVRERVEKFKLDEALDPETTYSCPLFEKGIGCLVHETAKPLPCIAHACYEREQDLPPDAALSEREIAVCRLNEKVYGRAASLLPLPYAILICSDGA